jgi:hypothetical protein
MKNKPIILTLCSKCASNFRAIYGGCIKRENLNQLNKDTCDYCQNQRGWDYVLEEKKKDERK